MQGRGITGKFLVAIPRKILSNISNSCFTKTAKTVDLKMEELEEPKRPPYECGSFISKQMKAEKAIRYFNAGRTSLESVWNLFEENKDEHEDIPKLLETYKNICEENVNICLEEKKYPLIVFEGLDGCGKSTTGMRLAKNLNAERVTTPPKSLSDLRKKFDGHPYLHAPFYYFGNYVAAVEVSKILKEKPVIMDRFWHSTTAFALAQMKEDYFDVMKSTEIPDKDSDIYEWPKDLLKPDIVILLNVSEEVRNERLSRRTETTQQETLLASKVEFRNNVILAYENMRNPSIQKVFSGNGFKRVLQEIDKKIKHLF